MPQGSILALSLFTLYTADIPPPGPGATDIHFADDITQIIIYLGREKQALALKTSREISRINVYEKQWKIQINKNKFQLISISATKPKDVIVDNAIIPFKNQVTVLGLNLTTRGISSHFKTRKAILANGQLIKLNRFKSLDERIKLHIYKGMIRPILEYPVVPICLASKTNIKKKTSANPEQSSKKNLDK